MYCQKCGKKRKEPGKFCGVCGVNFEEIDGDTNDDQDHSLTYYSIGWRKRDWRGYSESVFDIYISKKYIYIIKLPSFHSSESWMLVGFLLFNIFGAYFGYRYGLAKDNEKRLYYRKAWYEEATIKSSAYIPLVSYKIPLNQVYGTIEFKKNKIIILYEGKKILFKQKEEEINKIKEYVL